MIDYQCIQPWVQIRDETCSKIALEVQRIELPSAQNKQFILFISDCRKLSLTSSSMIAYIDQRLVHLIDQVKYVMNTGLSLVSTLESLHIYFQKLYDSIREQELLRKPEKQTYTAILYASPEYPSLQLKNEEDIFTAEVYASPHVLGFFPNDSICITKNQIESTAGLPYEKTYPKSKMNLITTTRPTKGTGMETKLDDTYKQMKNQTQQLHICSINFVGIIEVLWSRLLNSEIDAILAATQPVFRENVNRLLYGLFDNLDRLYHESQFLMKQIQQVHEHCFWEEYAQPHLCDRLLQSVEHQFTQISECIDNCHSTYNIFLNQYENCTQQIYAGTSIWEEITPLIGKSQEVLWEITRRYEALELNFNNT